jgi:hypothetical protein
LNENQEIPDQLLSKKCFDWKSNLFYLKTIFKAFIF